MGSDRVPDPTRHVPERRLVDMLDRVFLKRRQRDTPTLWHIVKDPVAIAHARFKVAWYIYLREQARQAEPEEISRYLLHRLERKIQKWQTIERKLTGEISWKK